MDYYSIFQDVLCQNKSLAREVIKRVLKNIQTNGTKTKQIIFITFNSDKKGVKLPSNLTVDTKELAIVISSATGFWNLKVYEDYFSVDLKFSGEKQSVEIPFLSIVEFNDTKKNLKLTLTRKKNLTKSKETLSSDTQVHDKISDSSEKNTIDSITKNDYYKEENTSRAIESDEDNSYIYDDEEEYDEEDEEDNIVNFQIITDSDTPEDKKVITIDFNKYRENKK